MADDGLNLIIDLNYITDPNATIKYSSAFGGVYKGAYSYVKLDWDAQTDIGLQGYNIYFGVFPLIRNKANTTINASTHYEMELPLFPQNVYFYFWISKVVNGVETFLNDDGLSTYDTAMEETIYGTNNIDENYYMPDTSNLYDTMGMIYDRIKKDRIMATQIAGVKCDVYFRRWGTQVPYGVPCTCTEDKKDPDFMGGGRCPLCFSTGIVGGFYQPIEMFLKFQMQPAQDFKGSIRGLTVAQTFDAWTVVPPFIREKDLIVRKIDGRRWEVSQVQQTFFKGAVTSQSFKLNLLPMTDIRQIVSLDNINKALLTLDNPKYNTPGRVVF